MAFVRPHPNPSPASSAFQAPSPKEKGIGCYFFEGQEAKCFYALFCLLQLMYKRMENASFIILVA